MGGLPDFEAPEAHTFSSDDYKTHVHSPASATADRKSALTPPALSKNRSPQRPAG